MFFCLRFLCAFRIVFLNGVHFWSTCLLKDYPPNSWNVFSLYPQPRNLLRCAVLKNKCLWTFAQGSSQNPTTCLCVFSESWHCVSWHQGDGGCVFLCHHPLKGEVIKSSMGAASCSALLHFQAFYLEMNRRPLHNEGGEEKILLKAEDVGGCAIAWRHLVWNSPVVPVYRRALSTQSDIGIMIILGPVKVSFSKTPLTCQCVWVQMM